MDPIKINFINYEPGSDLLSVVRSELEKIRYRSPSDAMISFKLKNIDSIWVASFELKSTALKIKFSISGNSVVEVFEEVAQEAKKEVDKWSYTRQFKKIN